VKLLVVGGNSVVGAALQTLLVERGVEHKILKIDELRFPKKMEVAKAVSQYAPTQLINVASYSNLELAEKDSDAARLCDEQNSLIPAVLAEVCAHLALPLIHHSSSLVFDGQKVHPYSEDDGANPVCRYGRSKWYGERSIRDALPTHIILRTDWVFSEQDAGFFQKHIDTCKEHHGRLEVINHRFSPTPSADVARVLLSIAQQLDCAAEVWGTYHYCSQQPLTQEAFVEQFLQEAGQYDEELQKALTTLQIAKLPVRLPYIANTVLNVQKIFETFGIKARTRNADVTALLRQLYHLQEAEAPVAKPAATEGKNDSVVKPPVKSRQPKARRRPSRKVAKQKAK
jgi:dTDP-4-dehydrorhamnose reductase